MSELNSTVSVLPSAAAAETVRGRLAAANIPCAVVEADGAFRLQVAESDFTRAMQLLFPLPTAEQTAALTAPGGAPWKCSHCGEEVQPVSNVCWACGTARDGAPPESVPQAGLARNGAKTAAAAAPPFIPPIVPPPIATAPIAPPPVAPQPANPAAAPATFAPASFAGGAFDPAALAAESFTAELARSAAAAAPVARDTPREPLAASSPAQEAAEPSTAAPPKQRARRPIEIEEPNPWLEPRLLVLWALLGVAICVISWLALR